MDDFPGLLARDFGFRPQGKSAPMAATRSTGTTQNLGTGSAAETPTRSFYSTSEQRKSGSFLDDHDSLFSSSSSTNFHSDSNQKNQAIGGLGGGGFGDVFGGPPKYTNKSSSLSEDRRGGGNGASSFDYDSIFQGSNDQGAKSSSLPVYDKPVYDDDIFEGVPGLKSSSSNSVKYDFDVFSSPPKSAAQFDDLLGNLGRKQEPKGPKEKKVAPEPPTFDDLLPGFGGTSPPSSNNRANPESTSSMMDDPFVVLESSSSTDPLDEIGKFGNSASTKVKISSATGGVFDDIDPLDGLGKSVPSYSSEINSRGKKDKSPLRTKPSVSGTQTFSTREPTEDYPVKFDMPSSSSDFHNNAGKPASPPSYSEESNFSQANMSPKSEENLESFDHDDDVWLTVSDILLYTQPTTAPPPSRPPPPRPPKVSKSETAFFAPMNSKTKMNEYSSFPHSMTKSPVVSQFDELEDFATGRVRNNVDQHQDVLSNEEPEANSVAAASAAAMKEAMDRAQAKFRHAKEVRERESAKATRSKESAQSEKDDNPVQDSQERELRERLERERQEKEREEEERRLEKEREREEKERERRRIEKEREMARQAVERATREARERAVQEARLKANRAAVEKATAEARERLERAAVQRAQAEARERAAADARERAEKAAAEARERANAEARIRVERAAVERAAAEARERAAANARASQQKNENDLESFFGMGSRPSSAPRPRANNSDPAFDSQFQSRGGAEGARRTSVGTASSMRKASSSTNIVDDLSSIFGGAPSSGDFQEVDGETEERRRARLERHQRTQERAAKALAEKNQRDLQVQRDQAERHRIAETLDIEIKRWSAGKEGNLRALLSTLQYVLWPECGWQPVSLTDLITGASVKKVYRKATLCIHPDKVQQKGANLQQKYIAEKVFDLLKEAWNKFNSEELF